MDPACGAQSRTGAGRFAAAFAAACLLLAFAAPEAPGARGKAPRAWPPADGPGKLFVHFGEEHVNDLDGDVLLPKIVEESARYRPMLVAMSGDKVNEGETEQLQLWSDVIEHYDRKRVPWFAAVGNHDRVGPPGSIEGTFTNGDFHPYQELFADRPYPMGDAPGYGDGILPREREGDDPDGAASHYFVDSGPVRWVFIDNSCWSITGCEDFQVGSGQSSDGETQLEFLERVGRAASERGKLVFVVMHIPTQDPGDESYRTSLQRNHVMGKVGGRLGDNALFEQFADRARADAVFIAHIKGQFLYRGEGGIPYFVDGGGGGELYTTGPVGTDHGYWHGFRLIRVHGGDFDTDAVPIFIKGSIEIAGPERLGVGETQTFAAFGAQPVFEHSAKVPALELRDPDPIPRSRTDGLAAIGEVAKWAGPLLALAVLLAVAGLVSEPRRRRLAIPALVGIGALGAVGVSAAQQSEPTSTPREALPNPARIWTSSDPLVLRPMASSTDDPRRNRRTETADGRFRAACPGHARLRITSGFESRSRRVTVPSQRGRIVRGIAPAADTIDPGDRATVARVKLAQRARVIAKATRGRRTIARLERTCAHPGELDVRWNGKRRNGKAAHQADYRVVVRVLSDRKPITRRLAVTVGR